MRIRWEVMTVRMSWVSGIANLVDVGEELDHPQTLAWKDGRHSTIFQDRIWDQLPQGVAMQKPHLGLKVGARGSRLISSILLVVEARRYWIAHRGWHRVC